MQTPSRVRPMESSSSNAATPGGSPTPLEALRVHKTVALPLRFDDSVTIDQRKQFREAIAHRRMQTQFDQGFMSGHIITHDVSGSSKLKWQFDVVDIPTRVDLMLQQVSDKSLVKATTITQRILIHPPIASLIVSSVATVASANKTLTPVFSTPNPTPVNNDCPSLISGGVLPIPRMIRSVARNQLVLEETGVLTNVTLNIARCWQKQNSMQAPDMTKVTEMEGWIKRFKDHKLWDEAFEIFFDSTASQHKNDGGTSAVAVAVTAITETNATGTGRSVRAEVLRWHWRELSIEGHWMSNTTELRSPIDIARVYDDLRTGRGTFRTKSGKRVGQIGVTVHGVFKRYERTYKVKSNHNIHHNHHNVTPSRRHTAKKQKMTTH